MNNFIRVGSAASILLVANAERAQESYNFNVLGNNYNVNI